MLDHYDKMMFELNFSGVNLTEDEMDFYLQILLHSKEIMESEVTMHASKPQFDIVTMSLRKDSDGTVLVNGAIANDAENKWIEGRISKKINNIYSVFEISRLHPSIPAESRMKNYIVAENFNFKDPEHVKRCSLYENGSYFESFLEPFNDRELESFKLSKINKMKK